LKTCHFCTQREFPDLFLVKNLYILYTVRESVTYACKVKGLYIIQTLFSIRNKMNTYVEVFLQI